MIYELFDLMVSLFNLFFSISFLPGYLNMPQVINKISTATKTLERRKNVNKGKMG